MRLPSKLGVYWRRFLVCTAVFEMILWTFAVPLLLAEVWSKWVGMAVFLWWMIGYWPFIIWLNIQQKRNEALLMQLIEEGIERGVDAQREEEKTKKLPDGWGEHGPVFSDN